MAPLAAGGICALLLLPAAAASAQPRPDPLREQYHAAQTFQLAGDLDRAERTYIEGVVPRALQRLASLSGAAGDLSEAARLLEAAIEVHPAFGGAAADLALLKIRQGELSQAAGLARGIERDPAADPDVRARAAAVLGRIDLLEGQAARAVERLEALGDRAGFESSYLLALAWLRAGEAERARAVFDRLIDAYGSAAGLHLLIGRAYRETGFPDLAAAEFARALDRGAPAVPAEATFRELVTMPFGGDARRLPPAAADEMRAQLADVLAHTYYNLGVIASRRGDAPLAVERLRRAAEWEPDLDGIDRAVGIASLAAGDPDAAAVHLRRHLAASPHDEAARALLSQAESQAGIADPSPATAPAAGAEPVPGGAPGEGDLGSVRGLLAEGEVEAAERALWNLLEQRPHEARVVSLLADVRLAQARDEEAAALLDRALQLDPSLAAAHVSLARLHRRAGRIDEARSALERALELARPDDEQTVQARIADEHAAIDRLVRARHLLSEAQAQMHVGQGDAAARLFEQALTLDADLVPALRGLAAVASARGDHGEAVSLLQRAWRQAPASAEVLADLTRAGSRAARLDEAIDAARALAALTPDDPEALFLLSVALLQRQDWPEARATLERLVDRTPDSPLGHLGLGLAHFGRRDYDAAAAAFERTLALDATQVEAHYHLALIAREQGRQADAIARLERTAALQPDHADAQTLLGTLYLAAREYDRARAALERAAALRPDAPEAHYQLALLHARVGDQDRAQQALDRFRAARAKTQR